MMAAEETPESLLRARQTDDPQVGHLYSVAYGYCNIAMAEIFGRVPDQTPIIRFGETPDGSASGHAVGSYQPVDSAMLHHVITIDPFLLRNGEDMARTLAHECVHMAQELSMRTVDHGEFFRLSMRHRFGLVVATDQGVVIDRTERWGEWFAEEVGHLGLDQIVFEGGEQA